MQLEDCLGAVHVRLTAEDWERLDAVASPGQAIVPYYEADFGPHRFRWECKRPLTSPPHASVREASTSRMARRLTKILPTMTLAEAIEIPRIPRVAGRTGGRTTWVTTWLYCAREHMIAVIRAGHGRHAYRRA